MGTGPNNDATFTQQLSQEIDAAHEAYSARQPDSETRLYRALRNQARNIVWRRLGSPDEPLQHDIATRAIQALQTFRGASRVSTWFYSVAQNEANRELRRLIQKREREVPIETDEDDAEPRFRLAAVPANLDTAIELEALTRDLPVKQADVFKMVEEGYSLEEIAERSGEPLGTIRSRYRLAKSKAKKKISPR
jgi:RNA polymerase sigma factor (sigma-70 family)